MVKFSVVWCGSVWCGVVSCSAIICGVLQRMTGSSGAVVACEDVNIIASFTLCFLLSTASLHTSHPFKSNGIYLDYNGINGIGWTINDNLPWNLMDYNRTQYNDKNICRDFLLLSLVSRNTKMIINVHVLLICISNLLTVFHKMWPFGDIHDRPKTNRDPSDILCAPILEHALICAYQNFVD